MRLGTAFALGFRPAAAGTFFHAHELVARAEREGALLATQKERVAVHGRATVEHVLAAEQLLSEIGLAAPERPQSYAAYTRWAEQASLAARDAARPDLHESSAFVLGSLLGDLSLMLSLRAVVAELRTAAPLAFLDDQDAALEADLTRRTAHVDLAAMNPGLPDAAHEALRALATALRTSDLDAAREGVRAAHAAIEALFATEPPRIEEPGE